MKNIYHVIGVMSGTSLDGVDLAYVKFEKKENWKFAILKTQTLSYSEEWKTRLGEAFRYPKEKLTEIDLEYTKLLAQIISKFISKNNISNPDAVCSHGHTVLHQPEKGITLQIGNLPILAKQIGQTVVCDFRKRDVELGGQGAPLVPIGDRLLFSEYDYCVNLGGFANVSTTEKGKTIAWDICPVNTVLNFYANKLGQEYDKNGEIATSGKVNEGLLDQLNRVGFYSQSPPKSLGIEWVNEKVFPVLEKSKLPEKNILATFTAHVAGQIGESLGKDPSKKALFTGGGVYNGFLMENIRSQSKPETIVPDKKLIEYKEALIFGLLGVLKLQGEVNILCSVTGARKNHSSGKVQKK